MLFNMIEELYWSKVFPTYIMFVLLTAKLLQISLMMSLIPLILRVFLFYILVKNISSFTHDHLFSVLLWNIRMPISLQFDGLNL